MSDTTGKVIGSTAAVGTAAGTAVAIGGSAATITSTLATIGGLFGGGMVAGITAVAAAPLVVGAAAYGAYKVLSDD